VFYFVHFLPVLTMPHMIINGWLRSIVDGESLRPEDKKPLAGMIRKRTARLMVCLSADVSERAAFVDVNIQIDCHSNCPQPYGARVSQRRR
jgi:hypothetical protein